MQNARLDESEARSKIVGRNDIRYVDGTTLMAETEEEQKSLLMEMKEESEKTGLKLTVQKTKIIASSSITSLQIEGEKMETEKLFSWAPKSLWTITTAMKLKDACSLEENDRPRQCTQNQRQHFADKGL